MEEKFLNAGCTIQYDAIYFSLADGHNSSKIFTSSVCYPLHKKWNFPVRVSSVNVNKPAFSFWSWSAE